MNRIQITLFITTTIATWALYLFIFDIDYSFQHLSPFAFTVSIMTIVTLLFDTYLWKLKLFRGWLVKKPIIEGEWVGELQSSWKDENNKPIPPIETIVTIKQRYTKFSLNLKTGESSSKLQASEVELLDDGTYKIYGVYQNTPSIHLRGTRSQIHYGAVLLNYDPAEPDSLSGHYWTDRNTNGSITLHKK
jgi:hypothetical protein